MNEQLETALNAQLYNCSIARSKIYDEIDDINTIMKTYSSYNNSNSAMTFKEYKSLHGHGEMHEKEDTEDIAVITSTSKLTYFQKQSDQVEHHQQTGTNNTAFRNTQTDLIRRFVETREVPEPTS